ncbi:MAG: hypothetical protein QM771_02835 [Nitrospira sp.]
MLDPPLQQVNEMMPAPSPAYVDVVLPRRLHRPFTYIIPSELKGRVAIGRSVVVPFGSQDLHGLVIAVYHRLPHGAPQRGLKAIRSLSAASSDHLLTADQIGLSRWIAERYAAPWGQCIKLVLPPVDRVGPSQPRYVPTAQGLATPSSVEPLGDTETELLARLRRRPKGIVTTTLLKGDKSRNTLALQALVQKGLVSRCEDPVAPKIGRPTKQKGQLSGGGLPMESVEVADGLELPHSEAMRWPAVLEQALAKKAFVSLLLEGNHRTRHGCLVQAVQATIRLGRKVFILTGDVEHASRLAGSLAAGGEQPMLLHSGLSMKARAAVWQAAQEGSVKILIGTRMAAFAPLAGLGLVLGGRWRTMRLSKKSRCLGIMRERLPTIVLPVTVRC